MPSAFVDTNVLLYCFSTRKAERAKKDIATLLLRRRDLVLSAQVLGEFYLQATRAGSFSAMSPEDAETVVRSLQRLKIVAVSASVVQAAIRTSQRFRVSYWDAAIIEAARAAGCETVLSEDLAHAQDYDGVIVRDPFRGGV